MTSRADDLRGMHAAEEILVLVNVWDVASARAVAQTRGCLALATASHSIAESHGYQDGENIPFTLMLAMIERICSAVELPVTADLEAGYGNVGETVRAAVAAGVVGANLEDGMRPLDHAVKAVAAAVDAAAGAGVPIVLNARTDTHLIDTGLSAGDRLDEAIGRGRAFLDAGADCVFVPGCTSGSEIRELVDAFGRGRLSLLGVPGLPDLAALQGLGVARVSYGPYPQRWAMEALTRRAAAVLGQGKNS
jgi:2-methylisocitrate lyase-like PEP mutase family enzyme